ncbi:MAG: biotin attachment protein [Candidatus Pacebacteria bacterium]|nr:biotin attachment protein [Candidatus Paceibacterota bacterium]
MKKIKFLDLSFRDGFQSVLGARVKTDDFLPALEAAVQAGTTDFEIGGGARFQSLYFYCQEDAFEMMDRCRQVAGPDVNLQTLARGVNVVGLSSQSRDIIDLHAKLFKKHSVTTIRNFDALNDVRNLDYSGRCIHDRGLQHQVSVTLMGLPPGLPDNYPHCPRFYCDRIREILDAEIPFDSVCFKDASGTATPATVYETIAEARKMLPEGTEIEYHTHCTAGMAVSCYMAAIEGGADKIDLAMTPVSGGTGAVDILTMWHRLKGTDYTLDIDYEKYLEAEEVFQECMDKYFMPPEAKETNPLITLSPMPGGALTANTQMMRDNNCMHLYNDVIKAMREVVRRGGYGTSVTPVSQFYFQQAFSNVTQGAWEKISEGYGKMVLGYFGKTPAEPDPDIVKLAAEQLEMDPTDEPVVDINDRNPKLGIEAARSVLKEEGLEETEENIFIVATCEQKGVAFLKGNAPLGIRYKEDEQPEAAPAKQTATPASTQEVGQYVVTVNGQRYNVQVEPGQDDTPNVSSIEPVASPQPVSQATAAAPTSDKVDGQVIKAPMPGTITRVVASEGETVTDGQTLFILEAMKMEVEIKAPRAGTLHSVAVSEGDTLVADQTVATIS